VDDAVAIHVVADDRVTELVNVDSERSFSTAWIIDGAELPGLQQPPARIAGVVEAEPNNDTAIRNRVRKGRRESRVIHGGEVAVRVAFR